jgi:hypothetical protein
VLNCSRFKLVALALLRVGCAPQAPRDASTADQSPLADASVEASTEVPDVSATQTMHDATIDAVDAADVSSEGSACAPHTVPCADESAARLRYLEPVNAAAIVNEPLADWGFRSTLDARAGGSMATQSYLYARFTERGLEKVSINDEAALRSTEWDIALRRFVIRLNSGVSGPSCVRGARIDGATYDSVTRVPDGLALRDEAYFDTACAFVDDRSGINGPATALASYWRYEGCLQMTNAVFAVRLRDGRAVKLTVESYYDPEAQRACDEAGAVPTPNNAAVLRVRWGFVQ